MCMRQLISSAAVAYPEAHVHTCNSVERASALSRCGPEMVALDIVV